jgi:hypothetical protein
MGLRSQYCKEWALISGLEVVAKILLEGFIYINILLFSDKNCVNNVGGYI